MRKVCIFKAMARHNTIKRILENIGLTANETRIYLAVLKFGELSVHELALKTNIHRTNLYGTVDSLIQKQALYCEHQGSGRKIIFASDPTKLKEILKKQQRTLKKASIKFEEIIPELKQMMKNPSPYSFAHCYTGIDGVKRVFLDTISGSSEDMHGFAQVGRASMLETAMPENWVKNVYRKRKVERNVAGNYICPDLGIAKNYIKGTYIKEGIAEFAPVFKELPFEEASDFSEVVTYEDKVALISFDQKEKMGVIIKSPILAKSFRALFDGVWKMAHAV
ncbi:MAG: Transcriptional regulator, TrmB [Parcubacteria group bacterium GW2011_GWA2_44_12]|nr:MAG: Transcriptional regulator, TrmB [Parcubacteria group bacterium GW2011_GWA2_44_12]